MDSQKLIPLCARNSEECKEYAGTQWKYAQFYVKIIDDGGKVQSTYLPELWLPKETGLNLRFKVKGDRISRKLVLEFTATEQSQPIRRAFLEFHVLDHVTGYETADMTVQEKIGQEARTAGSEMRDSYMIVRFDTYGGIGIGLDLDAPFLTAADKKLLAYARYLALNFSTRPNQRKLVTFRLNTRWIEYTSENAQTRRKRQEAQRLRRQVSDFSSSATWDLAPYRNEQGKVMTQWGMMMSREYVQTKSNGIMEFAAQVSFSTLDEAKIILTYGSFLEHQRELEIAQSVSSQPQYVAFVKVAGSTILAVVKFKLPESEDGDRFIPRDGTVVKIGFRHPHRFQLKKTFCSAIAVSNIFNLPYDACSVFYLTGSSCSVFQPFAVEVGKRLVYLPAAISIRVPSRGAQRQVDAINQLCQPHHDRWHKILLNHHAGPRQIINPFAGLDVSIELEAAISQVVSIPGIRWSTGQQKVIESLHSFPQGLLLVQGFPGTGKTLTLMGIAAVCRLLDIHVVYTTPTHFSADAACVTADKFMQLSHLSMDILGVYRPISEVRPFRNHGRDASQRATEEDATNPSEFTEIGPISQDTLDDEGFTPIHVSSEGQVLIAQLINIVRENQFSSSYGLPSKSLESHVIRLAMDKGREFIARYPSDGQIATSRGDLYDLIEGHILDPTGEEVDMLAELRKFIAMIQEKSFSQLCDQEKRKAILAFKRTAQLVIEEATFLVSTNNNIGCEMIARHFGKNAKAIIQIRDEDFKETESNGWIFVAKSAFSDKVKGIVSCGDEKQLRPTVLSAYDRPPLNEFCAQMTLPMPTRLSRMHHPRHRLDEQLRYRPCFTEFPNRRTYHGELRSHPSTADISVCPNYLRAIKSLVPVGPTPTIGPVAKVVNETSHAGTGCAALTSNASFNMAVSNESSTIDYGNLVISVNGSDCMVDESTKSRYNDAHRLFILQIILTNHRHGGYRGEDIAVITPYRAQVVRICQSFFRMVQHGMLKAEDVPKVTTTDSMQGKEAKLVIYDWVVSSAEKMSELGFTADDHRGNVGLTRVTEAMINILPMSIGHSRFLMQPRERHNHLGELIRSRAPYPCEFVAWANEKGILFEVDCPVEDDLIGKFSGGGVYGLHGTEEAGAPDSCDTMGEVAGLNDTVGESWASVDTTRDVYW